MSYLMTLKLPLTALVVINFLSSLIGAGVAEFLSHFLNVLFLSFLRCYLYSLFLIYLTVGQTTNDV